MDCTGNRGEAVKTLHLMRLVPDRDALGQWAAGQRQPRAVSDHGFVWHGLLNAVFGDHAPKPFVDRMPAGGNELLGYVTAGPATALPDTPPLAARACGLDTLRVTSMPAPWRAGRVLSFEVRARPIVRSRQGGPGSRPVEVDAAVAARRHDAGISREDAYRNWLARELAREDAAALLAMRLAAFRRTRLARRQGRPGKRSWSSAPMEGPDAWLRGHLEIRDGEAFSALLQRGVGRHRAFGYGCLLIAPRGVLA